MPTLAPLMQASPKMETMAKEMGLVEMRFPNTAPWKGRSVCVISVCPIQNLKTTRETKEILDAPEDFTLVLTTLPASRVASEKDCHIAGHAGQTPHEVRLCHSQRGHHPWLPLELCSTGREIFSES